MIQLHNINKTYKGRNFDVHALKDIDLHLKEGTYSAIVGKSGSGKSSLLKIMGLLDFNYSGEYIIMGKKLNLKDDSEVSQYRKKIGFVFQDFQLINRYTVKKNLEIASVIKLGYVNEKIIMESLERVDMSDKPDSYPDELSGGQKQRVSIARATLSSPKLLIADEPTGAIDEANTTTVLKLLDDIHKNSDTTIIVVTHDLDVAKGADHVIKLKDGMMTDENLFF